MTAGRPKDFSEARVLDKAVDVFWKQGYEATSLEDLLAAMGIGKGSMYHTFGNKRDVFERALARFMENFTSWFGSEMAKAANPIDFIKKFFRDLARQGKNEHKKGCFLGNTVAELAGIDPGLQKLAAGYLQQMETLFLVHIQRAQATGQLKTSEEPALLARHLINLWNGINISRRVYHQPGELLPLIDMQLRALG